MRSSFLQVFVFWGRFARKSRRRQRPDGRIIWILADETSRCVADQPKSSDLPIKTRFLPGFSRSLRVAFPIHSKCATRGGEGGRGGVMIEHDCHPASQSYLYEKTVTYAMRSCPARHPYQFAEVSICQRAAFTLS